MQDDEQPKTIPALLAYAAERFPEHEAVVDGDIRLTFAELAARVHGVAAGLIARGIRHGDSVAIWAPNNYRWVVSALAAATIGAPMVPLNSRYRGIEAHEILRRAKVKALFAAEGFLNTDYPGMLLDGAAELGLAQAAPLVPGLPELESIIGLPSGESKTARGASSASLHIVGWEELLQAGTTVGATEVQLRANLVETDDVADIVFTSGTTGRSKGVVSAHRQTLGVAQAWAQGAQVGAEDRYLIVSPFSHTFGYKVGILVCLATGATIYPMATFDLDETVRLLREEHITVLPGAPTIHQSILDHPKRPDASELSWRLAVVGSAMVPARLLERLREEVKVKQVTTAYGLSEAVVVSMCQLDDSHETISTTCGAPTAGFEVRIVDSAGNQVPPGTAGEILVRGENVMIGYLDDPEATGKAIDSNGWLHTGDMGMFNEQNYLSIVDRIKDMFTVGGFNVYPAEVEKTISSLEGVVACAVVGQPDDRMGEVARAYVEVLPSAGLDAEQIVAHCKRWLANYKVPRIVEITDSLPRNAMGKILKRELRPETVPVGGTHA
ncbi:fatty acid--CoA ligase [Arthrobacter sp. AQ5-05]|uniref:AMP-binding protein n=1 Tax=Arthrobacter sp. AQ5-05 TaxID=2184581 RepID=UPI000DCD5C0B|nr:AMP-binding protein [Arthrobacter sp. AQ5-05]RAX45959.1 fatty acid--CoA ligase [Arthrobacter sp. AQ5-05]